MTRQPSSPDILHKLRQDIRRLEGFKTDQEAKTLRPGVAALEELLPDGGLTYGAIHEFISENYEESAAATAFTLSLLSRAPDKGPLVWIARDNVQYVPGYAAYGLDPQRIIFVRPHKEQEVLWIMEEALRHKGLAAVVGFSAPADLTATRRLQLAAEESGVMGLLMRPFCKQPVSSSCMTRWQIKPVPSKSPWPGLGFPRWNIELLKSRGGRPGQCTVEWSETGMHVVEVPPKESIPTQIEGVTVIQLMARA